MVGEGVKSTLHQLSRMKTLNPLVVLLHKGGLIKLMFPLVHHEGLFLCVRECEVILCQRYRVISI